MKLSKTITVSKLSLEEGETLLYWRITERMMKKLFTMLILLVSLSAEAGIGVAIGYDRWSGADEPCSGQVSRSGYMAVLMTMDMQLHAVH